MADQAQRSPSPATGLDWGVFNLSGDTEVDLPAEQQALAQLAKSCLGILNGDDLDWSENEDVERDSAGGSESENSHGDDSGKHSDHLTVLFSYNSAPKLFR